MTGNKTDNNPDWKQLEYLVAMIQKQLSPDARFNIMSCLTESIVKLKDKSMYWLSRILVSTQCRSLLIAKTTLSQSM